MFHYFIVQGEPSDTHPDLRIHRSVRGDDTRPEDDTHARTVRRLSVHGYVGYDIRYLVNPFFPTVAFSQPSSNICCPRD